MADDVDKMNLAFDRVLESFKLKNLKDSQRDALEKLVGGQDVFVIQPTASGKSLIFQSAPIVFDTIRPLSNAKSIALVISPLASLMQDQVRYLKSVGIKAEFIGSEQESEHAKQRHRRRINYIFFNYVTDKVNRSRVQPSLFGEDQRPDPGDGGNRA